MIEQLEPRRLLSGSAPASLGGLTLKFTGFSADTGITYERVVLSGTDDSFVDRQDPTGLGVAGPYIYRKTGDNEATLKEHIQESQTILLHFTSATGGTADWSDDFGRHPVRHLSFTAYKGPWLYLYYGSLISDSFGTPEVRGTNQADDIAIAFDSAHKRIVVTAGGRSDTLKVGQSIYETTLAHIDGEAGDDQITINYPGTTFVDGGEGNDRIECNTARRNAFEIDVDNISGGAGNDVIYAGNRPSTVTGDAGRDLLIARQKGSYLLGGDDNDTLRGGDGNDTLTGGGGRDLIFGGAGSDRLNGNGGNDTLSGDSGNDRVYGGIGNDSLYGGSGPDRLYGEAGDDYLKGDNGADRLDGGDGVNHATADDGDVLIGIV